MAPRAGVAANSAHASAQVVEQRCGDLHADVGADQRLLQFVPRGGVDRRATADRAGDNGASVPSWSSTFYVNYDNGPIRASWSGRYISAGHVDNTYIECQANCPAVIPAGFTTIDNNHVESNFTQDVTLAYRFMENGGSNAEVFLTVNNLMNTNPPYITQSGNAYQPHTNAVLYDAVGREFHLGIRFKM